MTTSFSSFVAATHSMHVGFLRKANEVPSILSFKSHLCPLCGVFYPTSWAEWLSGHMVTTKRHEVSADEIQRLSEFREWDPGRRGLEWRPITSRQMAWSYHPPGYGGGGGRRKCTGGIRSQILCGADPHLLLGGISFLQQRYHAPVGTGNPVVPQPGHWQTCLPASCSGSFLFWMHVWDQQILPPLSVNFAWADLSCIFSTFLWLTHIGDVSSDRIRKCGKMWNMKS